MTATPAEGSDSWCTPKWLADALGPFDLDPCSNARSHIQSMYQCSLDSKHRPMRDGLALNWRRWSVFLNWPYSNPLPWARKVSAHEGPWCVLAKLDPSTKWWAALMSASPIVAPFRKRIAFETSTPGKRMTANFPSVLVYSAWRPPAALRPHLWLPTYEVAA